MTEIDPGNPYSPHKSWNNRTEREELIEIISLKLGQMIVDDKPDRLGYTKSMIIADSILEWHKKTALSWFKEQLPKKKEEKIQNNAYLEGAEYNQCLQDTLTNLEEKK